MSLYGLDFLIGREGKQPKYFLNEINGVASGMNGFQVIYGDNRVQEQVYQMLQDKHGVLTINNGSYGVKQFKRKHPIKALLGYIIARTPILRNLLINPVLLSQKADLSWANDIGTSEKNFDTPFEIYDGQDSTVINLTGELLDAPLLNPHVCEELTRSKFLQYWLLKDTELSENLPETVLVGLGGTDEAGLERLMERYRKFVIKPVMGACGRGVRIAGSDDVKRFLRTSGSVDNTSVDNLFAMLIGRKQRVRYFEDLVETNNFSFEFGASVVQQYVNSSKKVANLNPHESIRAIVCNGQFVDAYRRVSLKNPIVNLSRNARAFPLDYNPEFKVFCEEVVTVFERECANFDPVSFKRKLYDNYLDVRGRIPEEERYVEGKADIVSITGGFMGGLK